MHTAPHEQDPQKAAEGMAPTPRDGMRSYRGNGLLEGQQAPYGRAADPDELAPSYVFFAAGQMSSYYSGEVFAALGGETTPG